MERLLGDMGEADFMRMCSAGGLVCNKSTKDVTGWDFIVEFPFHLNTAPLADKEDPPVECKVQVKATNGTSKKVQIELSNLMRLCKYSHPAFIFFLEYDHKETAQRAYLLHISKEIMFKVFKRARENSVAIKRVKFNKTKLTIPFSDNELLPEVSSAALKAAIKKHIPGTLQSYISEKMQDMENLGYEDGHTLLTFSTPTDDALNNFVDALIGIETKVQVSNIFGFDCRFGVNVPVESLTSDSAIIQMVDIQSVATGELMFYNEQEARTLRFGCEIFTPPAGAKIPKEYLKVRFKCELFDVSINFNYSRFDFKFSNDVSSASLFALRDASLLMEWIWKVDNKINITISRHDTNATATYAGLSNSGSEVDSQFLENISLQVRTLNNAISLAQRLGLESHIKVNYNELLSHNKNINAIHGLFLKESTGALLKFNVHKMPAKEIDKTCCITVFSCCLGDFRIYIICTFSGNASLIGSEYMLYDSRIEIHDFFECRRSENKTAEVQAKVDEIAAQFESEDVTIVDFFSKRT